MDRLEILEQAKTNTESLLEELPVLPPPWRPLKLFSKPASKSKVAQSVVLPTGETRYESSHLDAHHHHFQCRKCEHVYDLGVCPVGIPNGTLIPGGFQVDSHELTLFGLCPACLQNKKTR